MTKDIGTAHYESSGAVFKVSWPKDQAAYVTVPRGSVLFGGFVLHFWDGIHSVAKVLNSYGTVSNIATVRFPKNPEALRAISKCFADAADYLESNQNGK